MKLGTTAFHLFHPRPVDGLRRWALKARNLGDVQGVVLSRLILASIKRVNPSGPRIILDDDYPLSSM